MIHIAANALLTIGFCVATVGAAGFAETIEPKAWPLLIGGTLVIVVGGYVHRLAKAAKTEGEGGSGGGLKQEFRRKLDIIRQRVVDLDEQKSTRSPQETREAIDGLLRDEYFDLTSKNEDWIASLGFAVYSQVWDGVAVAERLLSRAWSMMTDGSVEEGLAELPIARQALETADAKAHELVHAEESEAWPPHPGI